MNRRGVLCLSCRNLTSSGVACEHCGARLEPREEPPPQRGPLELLRQYTLELRSGDLDVPAFLERLDQREAQLRHVLDGLAALDIPEDMQLEVSEELQAGRQGIEGFLQALEALREWANTGNREAMDRGMALATQATARMNDAIRMNWRAFRTYQESAEEYLEQTGYRP